MANARFEDAAASFNPLRQKLMRVAYRMLGSVLRPRITRTGIAC